MDFYLDDFSTPTITLPPSSPLPPPLEGSSGFGPEESHMEPMFMFAPPITGDISQMADTQSHFPINGPDDTTPYPDIHDTPVIPHLDQILDMTVPC